jgi:hypothetical protein
MQKQPTHNLPQGVRDADARRTGCDVCGKPATVIVRCASARFAGFRCATDGRAIMEYFGERGLLATADALVSPEMAVTR